MWQGKKLIQVRQADHNFVNKTWQHYYLYEPNSHAPIALYDRDTGVQDIETDHLGTPISVYQHDTGETLWAGDFETYGKRKCQKAANQEDSSGQYDPKLRFQGQYEDKETGLYQNLHRYYDPHAGRYITHDPIGLYGGLNAYQYCPNPVEWIDPLGLSCKESVGESSKKGDVAKGDRVRHFTNSKGVQAIKESNMIKASDQNSVFTVKAKGKPGSPRDVEQQLGIGRGRANHIVEFDANSSEFSVVENPITGATERVFKGDVDLSNRNPTFKKNR
ncbi:HYD1 signature containing ADP-ribosyltransferase family protein [Marinomonas mediterranea]|uniref:RHS repeat-associated core domain n=1 Tax=Marinomonas mediterranea (strain ATCC 700492 / JCM 21426 / NBRC 103028 / MMB-1) TaxID=717774 RepID=F2JTT5_MARM1|nr:HYD1 signature containing ADP-ribosyltransferase family protein [Marinomonas mediterranea]ADZ92705.1 RHS repeat-associated core domain [Marinomonas mediterranea MMB-1]WCN10639.1 hypothetical protein GV055_17760 [Marinomonas mediterranea]WCN14696.1 hypothetical protein GV054_17635 [Marinomonas mediterranea]WCN18735.1 hypothetical protein GV053_17660 [Marinomonas mediterranea MMB-1]